MSVPKWKGVSFYYVLVIASLHMHYTSGVVQFRPQNHTSDLEQGPQSHPP